MLTNYKKMFKIPKNKKEKKKQNKYVKYLKRIVPVSKMKLKYFLNFHKAGYVRVSDHKKRSQGKNQEE